MAEAVLIVRIDSKGNVKVIREAGEELKQVGEKGEATGKKLVDLKKIGDRLLGSFDLLNTARSVVEFGEFGAEVEATTKRFEAFAGSQEQAQAYLAAFADATDGAIDRMGAMAGASKMLQMGLVDNADEMGVMAAVAVRLGDQTQDAGARLADFSALLANRSIPRLDNFGISSGKVRERVEELKEAGYDLDEAFKMAVLEEGTKSLEVLGDTSELTATKIGQLKAAFLTAKQVMAEEFATSVADMLPGMGDLTSKVMELEGALRVGVQFGMGNYGKAFEMMKKSHQEAAASAAAAAVETRRWQGDEEELRKEIEETRRTVDQANEAVSWSRDEYGLYADVLGEVEVAHLGARAAAERHTEELERQQRAMVEAEGRLMDFGAAYTRYYRDVNRDAEDYTQRREEIEAEYWDALLQVTSEKDGERSLIMLREANARYDEELALLEESRAAQEAEQQRSLGQMLLQHFEAWGTMKGLTVEQMTEMRLKIMEDYGLITAEGAEAARQQTAEWEAYFSSSGRGWDDVETKANSYYSKVKEMDGYQATMTVFTHYVGEDAGWVEEELLGRDRQYGGPASGLTLVGEGGPELLQLPTGSYVHSTQETKALFANAGQGDVWAGGGRGGGTQVFLELNVATGAVRGDEDIERIMAGMERLLTLQGARVMEV